MNKSAAIIGLIISTAVAIGGEFASHQSGGGPLGFMVGGVFCVAFGIILLLSHLQDDSPIKLGSETLPSVKDVSAVLVGGCPISTEAKNDLLRAIRKARRASSCGTVLKEIPFQIVDHWGGIWELRGHEENGGKKGFSINRVYYAGSAAATVAKCVGI